MRCLPALLAAMLNVMLNTIKPAKSNRPVGSISKCSYGGHAISQYLI